MVRDLTITPGARLATVGLLILTLLAGGGNLWATYGQVGAVRAAEARAARAAATVTQLCETGNEFRAQQASLWDYVIHLSKPPQTAAQRAVVARFEHYLHLVTAPRNCRALLARPEVPR